jgi:hypothetical protein
MTDSRECPNCRSPAAHLEPLTARVAAPKEELRQARGQAAPFGKDRPKADSKPPRRKLGHPAAFRPAPSPGEVPEVIRVPLELCPRYGGAVESVFDNAPLYQTDLPEILPVIRHFDAQRGWCPRCHKRVERRHPGGWPLSSGCRQTTYCAKVIPGLVKPEYRKP